MRSDLGGKMGAEKYAISAGRSLGKKIGEGGRFSGINPRRVGSGMLRKFSYRTNLPTLPWGDPLT